MNKKILFVVEGMAEKSELNNAFLQHLGLSKEEYQIFKYNTSIHELYDLLNKPENIGISLTAILLTDNKIDVDLNTQVDSTFSSIYLIFDYDPQYHKYDSKKLEYLVNRFNNETEEGLLILNYPMFESMFDIEESEDENAYSTKVIKKCSSAEYKDIVFARTSFRKDEKHYYKHLYHKEDILKCCNFNLFKYLKLLNYKTYTGIETNSILTKQTKLLNENDTIYVLNTMVLLYFDYNSNKI